MTKSVRAWAVTGKDGIPMLHTVSDDELISISRAFAYGVARWENYFREGYRCVRVTVTVEGGE